MFEIKIFANPNGYGELRLSNPNPIFSQDIVSRINFDAGGPANINGSYSIFYAADVYVLTHHFDASSEAKFRDKRVHIAIALKRGVGLNNAYDVFESLKMHFHNISNTYKEGTANAVANDSQSFRSIVQNALTIDDFQLKINQYESKKAIVTYETQEQLNLLLASPNRRDFIGYNHIYILPRAEAELNWQSIRLQNYSHLPLSSYSYTPTYELKFPDGHNMIIVNLTEVIRHECSVRYYKTRVYEGSVKDHYADWSIERSADGCVFEIPLTTLEPDIREYSIQFIDKNGKRLEPSQGNIVFDGIGEYNQDTKVLRLSGKSLDWEKMRSPIPGWSTADYSVIRVEAFGTPITGFNVVLLRYFDYSGVLSQHYEYLRAKVGDSAFLYLRHNGSQETVDKNSLQMSWRKPYLPSEVEIVYPATPQYNSVTVKFDGKHFQLPHLEAKPSKKVAIYITNPNLKLKDIQYSYSFGGQYTEPERVRTLPIEIDWKAGRSMKLQMEAPGYKKFRKEYDVPLDKKIEVTLEKTLISKILLPLVYLICALLVFCTGAFCGVELQKKLSLPAETEYEHKLAVKDAQIDSLNSVVKAYEDQINELQSKIEGQQAAKDKKNQQTERRKRQLQERFKTADFTQSDIDEYVRLIGGTDEFSIASQYCLEIINVKKKKDRETIIITGSDLNKKLEYIKEHTLYRFYARIINDENEFGTAYINTNPPTKGFKTLQEAYDAYSN